MDPTIPAETVTPTDEEIAKKMYEDELKLTQKIESDELVARQLQAKQDARLAKQLQADDSDQGGEGQQSGPARQSKPAEGEGAGFWGWFDKVAKKSEELVDAAAKNIEEFGEKVRYNSSHAAAKLAKLMERCDWNWRQTTWPDLSCKGFCGNFPH
jgi:hypothetical protein